MVEPGDRDDDDGAPGLDGAERVARALRELTPSRLFCGARAIADAPIHPGEKALYADVDASVRRATSTGRLLAREVLRNMGVTPGPILRGEGGMPSWPAGIGGSIAHDDEFAVCVVGFDTDVGVDVEPAAPLPAEILDTVLVNADERAAADDDLVAARLIFCAKEAVYKICYPVERRFYEFGEIVLQRPSDDRGPLPKTGVVDLHFVTSTGRRANVLVVRAPRLIAVARPEWVEGLYTR